jgi:excisionase family DNA binding protein
MTENQVLILDLDALAEKIVSRLKLLVKVQVPEPEDRSYTINDLAKLNGVSNDTIRKLLRAGKLRRIKGIRHVRVPAKEWNRFLEENLGEWESTWSHETTVNAINKRKKGRNDEQSHN